MFENKRLEVLLGNGRTEEVRMSRIIVSWVNVGGSVNDIRFRWWLERSLGLKDEDVWEILQLAKNGKYELEQSAKKYLNKM